MKYLMHCGAMRESVGLSDIVCDASTGDVVLVSDMMGQCLFSNVSVADPTYFADPAVVNKLCDTYDCDGVIMTYSYLITLKDNIASYRSFLDLENVAHTVEFDLFIDYEGEIRY